jgi:hypothetical protein
MQHRGAFVLKAMARSQQADRIRATFQETSFGRSGPKNVLRKIGWLNLQSQVRE